MADYHEILTWKNDMEKVICQHLIQQCETDPVLKNDVETSTGKTVHGMMRYLHGNARKQSDGNVVMVEDSTVYNWSFDYWHDPEIKEATEKAPEPAKKEAKASEKHNFTTKTKTKPEKPKTPAVERISLFEL